MTNLELGKKAIIADELNKMEEGEVAKTVEVTGRFWR